MSRPGWNTPQELTEVRRHFEGGQAFDVVVLGICLNDIGEFVEVPPEFGEATQRFRRPPRALAPLVDRSFLASFLYTRYVGLTSPVIGRVWGNLAASYRSPAAFQPLARQLEAFKQVTVSAGAAFIVVTFPDIASRWEEYPYRDVHRQLDEFWRRLGVTHVDLLPLFERHPPAALQVGLLDTHPNELAHRLAAAAATKAVMSVLGRTPSAAEDPKPPANGSRSRGL